MTNPTGIVYYDFFDSRFGRGLIAGSDCGICEISFADSSHSELIHDLESEYPDYQLEYGPGRFADICRSMFSAREPDCELDLHGSQFQMKVWSELRRVPTGETVSYQQLAKRLGRPRSTRAVANAVAKNRVAFLVPCHRVIRADGTVGGYRWGPERKSAILEWEGALTGSSDRTH